MFNDKKKVSMDLQTQNYQVLTERAKEYKSNAGRLTNRMIDVFLTLPDDVNTELARFCISKKKEMEAMLQKAGAFEAQDLRIKEEAYNNLALFFSKDNPPEEKNINPDYATVYLKDGYLSYPKDWILMPDALQKPEESSFAGVVEIRNPDPKKYSFPHFLFFTNKRHANDYTKDEDEKINAACIRHWPQFREILNNQIPPAESDPSDPEYFEKIKRHMNSPYVGHFSICRDDDPLTKSPFYEAPYGCLIHKEAYESPKTDTDTADEKYNGLEKIVNQGE